MRRHEKNTGRSRYRKNWRGKMIFQVEVLVLVDDDVGYGMGTHSHWCAMWRDATVSDMLELKLEWAS